jgi:two-component system, OmpR family, sensor histidine kinase KdpD
MTRDSGDRRPSPAQFLKRIEEEKRQKSRGKLKVLLGYASGVGKSLRLLDEGRRRKERGEDVVVVVGAARGAVSPAEEDLLGKFESIPPDPGSGGVAIDVPAVIRRRPQVALVDGLAYENPPGSRHPQRWQDIEELLAAGISVITSVNLQYVAERQAQVEVIRGKSVRESVPESFLRGADEIEVVDAPAEYAAGRVAAEGSPAPAGLPRLERLLSELREIALLMTAEIVDHQLGEYLRRAGIDHLYATHERILVCITPRSHASLMIRRGRRQADRFHGDLHVVHACQEGLDPKDQAVLDENLRAAREAGAHVEILEGTDPAHAILDYAGRHGITQIFVGHSLKTTWKSSFTANLVERLILEADGIDVRVFPHHDHR